LIIWVEVLQTFEGRALFMLNNAVEKLAEKLRVLVTLCAKSLDIAKRKRECLVKVKVEELDVMHKEEELLMKEISKAENERKLLLRELAKENTIFGEPKLSSLLLALPEKERSKLCEVADELTKIAVELAFVNDNNADLTGRALNYVNFNINLLTQVTADVTYGNHTIGAAADNKQQQSSRNYFEAKV